MLTWCIIVGLLALHVQAHNSAADDQNHKPLSITDDEMGQGKRSVGQRHASMSNQNQRRRFHFSLPRNEDEEESNCFIQVMAPKRVGGRCGVTEDGKAFCGARGFTYMDHPQCPLPRTS